MSKLVSATALLDSHVDFLGVAFTITTLIRVFDKWDIGALGRYEPAGLSHSCAFYVECSGSASACLLIYVTALEVSRGADLVRDRFTHTTGL